MFQNRNAAEPRYSANGAAQFAIDLAAQEAGFAFLKLNVVFDAALAEDRFRQAATECLLTLLGQDLHLGM